MQEEEVEDLALCAFRASTLPLFVLYSLFHFTNVAFLSGLPLLGSLPKSTPWALIMSAREPLKDYDKPLYKGCSLMAGKCFDVGTESGGHLEWVACIKDYVFEGFHWNLKSKPSCSVSGLFLTGAAVSTAGTVHSGLDFNIKRGGIEILDLINDLGTLFANLLALLSYC